MHNMLSSLREQSILENGKFVIDSHAYALSTECMRYGTQVYVDTAIEKECLEILTGDMLNLHIEDHTRITTIAPRRTIVLREGIIEGPCWVLFNPLHDTAKLGGEIGVIEISDRNSNTPVTLNVAILLAGSRVRELDILSIPQKPHGRRLRCSIRSDSRQMCK